jgi:hypothetical protein
MDNDVACMRRQSGKQRGLRLHSHNLRHLPTPHRKKARLAVQLTTSGLAVELARGPTARRIASCAAGCAAVVARSSFLHARSLCVQPNRRRCVALARLVPKCKQSRKQASSDTELGTNHARTTHKRRTTKARDRKKAMLFNALYVFCLSLPYLSTCRARAEIVFLFLLIRNDLFSFLIFCRAGSKII